ncbi:hypothetical protein [Sphingobium lactosutens]|nr:hypothetical protein [Sphingobium lactosutens]
MKAKTKKMVAGVFGFLGRSVVWLAKNPATQAIVATVVKHRVKSGVAATLIVATYEAFAGNL